MSAVTFMGDNMGRMRAAAATKKNVQLQKKKEQAGRLQATKLKKKGWHLAAAFLKFSGFDQTPMQFASVQDPASLFSFEELMAPPEKTEPEPVVFLVHIRMTKEAKAARDAKAAHDAKAADDEKALKEAKDAADKKAALDAANEKATKESEAAAAEALAEKTAAAVATKPLPTSPISILLSNTVSQADKDAALNEYDGGKEAKARAAALAAATTLSQIPNLTVEDPSTPGAAQAQVQQPTTAMLEATQTLVQQPSAAPGATQPQIQHPSAASGATQTQVQNPGPTSPHSTMHASVTTGAKVAVFPPLPPLGTAAPVLSEANLSALSHADLITMLLHRQGTSPPVATNKEDKKKKKKPKRKAGDPATTEAQQLDDRVREKLGGVMKPMRMTQVMSMGTCRADGYMAPDDSEDETDEAVAQKRWAHVIHGPFCITEMKANDDGSNGAKGTFLRKPKLIMNVGSEYLKAYVEQLDLNSLELVVTVCQDEYMGQFVSKSAKKKSVTKKASLKRAAAAKEAAKSNSRKKFKARDDNDSDGSDGSYTETDDEFYDVRQV